MNEVNRTPQATQDLIDLATYLYLADPISDVSERFLTAAENEFLRLAQMPGMGTAYPSDFGRSANLRRWPIPGFRNYLIFYRPVATGVEVIRVLHGSRDIAAAFGEYDTN